MRFILPILLFALCQVGLQAQEKITPKQALSRLMAGNERFVKDGSIHPERTKERRLETAERQEPFAVILGCSDSRVSPEIIFDQGIGELFIVRIAGNVVGHIELDSIEYPTLYLNSSLVMVLGHENCGAVKAVLDGNTKDIEAVATLIEPAAERTKGQGEDRLENTIKMNVKLIVQQLKNTPVLSNLITQKKLNIVGAYYNFHTGKVELLSGI